jgi:hypothetical protein
MEPALPMLRIDPELPILRILPTLPMLSTDLALPMLRTEPALRMLPTLKKLRMPCEPPLLSRFAPAFRTARWRALLDRFASYHYASLDMDDPLAVY